MTRHTIINAACMFLLIGLGSGLVMQIELLTPGISFIDHLVWAKFVPVHKWVTPLSLGVLCLMTLPLIRHKKTLGHWVIWLGFGAVLLLLGGIIHAIKINATGAQGAFADTIIVTAYKHAYGTAGLLVALGGLTAFKRLMFDNVSLILSFIFAFLIAISGGSMVFFQEILALQGMPRLYADYPQAYAPMQFLASLSAIACFTISALYLILMWRWSDKNQTNIADAF